MDVPFFRFNIWLDNYEDYNCSALGDVHWNKRGMSRPYFGFFCILFGLITIPPYCACAITMLPMRNLTVYKSWTSSPSSTAQLYSGFSEVFCAHPRLQFIYSFGGELTFYSSTLICSLLALNRFGEMLSIRAIVWLFEGSRTWCVIAICTIPYIFVILFTPPLLFNSNGHMIQYDPMITEGRYVYDNSLIFSIVTILPISSLFIYVAMLIGLFYKHGNISKMKKSSALGKATFQIVIQSGIVISVHLSTVIAFEILPFFPPEAVDSMLFVAHIGWMLTHGSPSLVYLLVNQTIRGKLLDFIRRFRSGTTVEKSSTSRNSKIQSHL